VILTRSTANSVLRESGLKLRERIGFERAAVAVARKLAVIMHAMLKSAEMFDRKIVTPVQELHRQAAVERTRPCRDVG
jgi:transposase